ncbi:MAG TPA: hypothetical protein VLC11_08340, partial [Gemmatimonadales bacterium]|nr:hypothetical protein [Gemmatimonadales bacterium]
NALTPPVDLIATPEKALDPDISAEITALFCKDKGIPALAAAGQYDKCSEVWNGGRNGEPEYLAMTALLATHLP